MGRRTARSTGTGLFSALVPLRSAGFARSRLPQSAPAAPAARARLDQKHQPSGASRFGSTLA